MPGEFGRQLHSHPQRLFPGISGPFPSGMQQKRFALAYQLKSYLVYLTIVLPTETKKRKKKIDPRILSNVDIQKSNPVA